jgi:hypothetical protein
VLVKEFDSLCSTSSCTTVFPDRYHYHCSSAASLLQPSPAAYVEKAP